MIEGTAVPPLVRCIFVQPSILTEFEMITIRRSLSHEEKINEPAKE